MERTDKGMHHVLVNFVFDLRQQLDLPGCDEIVLSELGRYVKTSTIENVLYTSLADALLVLHYHRSEQSEFWERVQPLLGDWNIDELAQNVVDAVVDADKALASGYWPWVGEGEVPITIDDIRYVSGGMSLRSNAPCPSFNCPC